MEQRVGQFGLDDQMHKDPGFMALSMEGASDLSPFVDDCNVEKAEPLGLRKSKLKYLASGTNHACVVIETGGSCEYLYVPQETSGGGNNDT